MVLPRRHAYGVMDFSPTPSMSSISALSNLEAKQRRWSEAAYGWLDGDEWRRVSLDSRWVWRESAHPCATQLHRTPEALDRPNSAPTCTVEAEPANETFTRCCNLCANKANVAELKSAHGQICCVKPRSGKVWVQYATDCRGPSDDVHWQLEERIDISNVVHAATSL
jgi:hypothetical protein